MGISPGKPGLVQPAAAIMVINSSKNMGAGGGFNCAVTLMRFNHFTPSCVPSG
jgi:hypothetical protein